MHAWWLTRKGTIGQAILRTESLAWACLNAPSLSLFFLVTGLCAAATLIDGDGLDVCTYCTYMRYRVSESPKVAWPLPCRYHRWPRQCKLSLPECHCRNGLPEHSMFLADRSGLLMGFMFRNRASVADCEDSGAWPTRRIAPSRPSPLSRPSHRRPL